MNSWAAVPKPVVGEMCPVVNGRSTVLATHALCASYNMIVGHSFCALCSAFCLIAHRWLYLNGAQYASSCVQKGGALQTSGAQPDRCGSPHQEHAYGHVFVAARWCCDSPQDFTPGMWKVYSNVYVASAGMRAQYTLCGIVKHAQSHCCVSACMEVAGRVLAL